MESCLVSLGPKAQYADYVASGNVNMFKYFTNGVVPKSQVTVDTTEQRWRYYVYLPNVLFSEIIVGCICAVILVAFVTIVVILYCKEQKEDRWDKDRTRRGFA